MALRFASRPLLPSSSPKFPLRSGEWMRNGHRFLLDGPASCLASPPRSCSFDLKKVRSETDCTMFYVCVSVSACVVGRAEPASASAYVVRVPLDGRVWSCCSSSSSSTTYMCVLYYKLQQFCTGTTTCRSHRLLLIYYTYARAHASGRCKVCPLYYTHLSPDRHLLLNHENISWGVLLVMQC